MHFQTRSKDTTRYLLAALFVSSEIKLRIAGQDYNVPNDETLAALSSNKALSVVGISLREGRPDPDAMSRASERLRDLTGEDVLPLEDRIAAAAKKHFPAFQQNFSALAADLRNLNLPGAERAENLASDLADVVRGDGSAAILLLGAADSPLFESLKWAKRVQQAFKIGLKQTIASLQTLREAISQLPASGVPGKLRLVTADRLDQVADILAKDAFYDQAAFLAQAQIELEKQIATAVNDLTSEQTALLQTELAKWQTSSDWVYLTPDDRAWIDDSVGQMKKPVEANLTGLRILLAHYYDLNERIRALGSEIASRAEANRIARQKPVTPTEGEPPVITTVVDEKLFIPSSFATLGDIDRFITMLQSYRKRIEAGERVRLMSHVIPTDKPGSLPTYD